MMTAPRILNVVALTLIALSLIAQGVGFGLFWHRSDGDVASLAAFGMLSWAVLPGALLAFTRFWVCAIRGRRSARARIEAVVYLLIATSPFAGSAILSAQRARPADVPTASITAPPEAAESEQFLAGLEWAKGRDPARYSECPGSEDFRRGCLRQITERRRRQFQEGREWAASNAPAKASQCQGAPHFIAGCRNYYLERLAKPKPAGQGKYEGMTTTECKAEVNANYEASERLNLEDGNTRAAEVTRRRHWIPELADCENYDKLAQNAVMTKAYSRLSAAVAEMKAGRSLTGDEAQALASDHEAILAFPPVPYREACLALWEEYRRLASPVPAAADVATRIYRCTGADGVEFRETPCPEGVAQKEMARP